MPGLCHPLGGSGNSQEQKRNSYGGPDPVDTGYLVGLGTGGLGMETPYARPRVAPTLSLQMAGRGHGRFRPRISPTLAQLSLLLFPHSGDFDLPFFPHPLPPRAESKLLLHAPGVLFPPIFFCGSCHGNQERSCTLLSRGWGAVGG